MPKLPEHCLVAPLLPSSLIILTIVTLFYLISLPLNLIVFNLFWILMLVRRDVSKIPKFCHFMPILKSFDWFGLRINKKIHYKVIFFTELSKLSSGHPSYLYFRPSFTLNRYTCFSYHFTFRLTYMSCKESIRSFCHSAPHMWNNYHPPDLCQLSHNSPLLLNWLHIIYFPVWYSEPKTSIFHSSLFLSINPGFRRTDISGIDEALLFFISYLFQNQSSSYNLRQFYYICITSV